MASRDTSGGLWDTVKMIFWALLIAAAFRSFLFQPFSIPSGSMKPTLLVGDYLFVTKFAYGYSNYSLPFAPDVFSRRVWTAMPERGDVVVFKHPKHDACTAGPIESLSNLVLGFVSSRPVGANDCIDYVKRVVGLPGDEIQVISGILHINGEPLKTVRTDDYVERKVLRGLPPRPPLCANNPVRLGGTCLKEQYVETFSDGRSHRILNITGEMGTDNGSAQFRNADNTPVFEVPANHFFFMGDNRDNSIDSRFPALGFVPFENLIGRADVIAISADGPFWQIWNWRSDRFLKSIE